MLREQALKFRPGIFQILWLIKDWLSKSYVNLFFAGESLLEFFASVKRIQ